MTDKLNAFKKDAEVIRVIAHTNMKKSDQDGNDK